MLTEGWDVKSVSHILGLRAFGSPLLTEQIIGRGLRRTNYNLIFLRKRGLDSCFLVEVNGLAAALKALW